MSSSGVPDKRRTNAAILAWKHACLTAATAEMEMLKTEGLAKVKYESNMYGSQ